MLIKKIQQKKRTIKIDYETIVDGSKIQTSIEPQYRPDTSFIDAIDRFKYWFGTISDVPFDKIAFCNIRHINIIFDPAKHTGGESNEEDYIQIFAEIPVWKTITPGKALAKDEEPNREILTYLDVKTSRFYFEKNFPKLSEIKHFTGNELREHTQDSFIKDLKNLIKEAEAFIDGKRYEDQEQLFK